jgi:hypothetical protein
VDQERAPLDTSFSIQQVRDAIRVTLPGKKAEQLLHNCDFTLQLEKDEIYENTLDFIIDALYVLTPP